jgi:hypothetical protein
MVPERFFFLRTNIGQKYTFLACVTQKHLFLESNAMIINLRYVMAQKSDEVGSNPAG